MKATGIVRRIDDLGRIVIPKEIRRSLRIREGEPLEIFTDKEGGVVFKKYSPIGEVGEFTMQYAEAINKSSGIPVAICDLDNIIAVAGVSKKDYLEKPISSQMSNLLERRQIYTSTSNVDELSITEDSEGRVSYLSPIISEGSVVGAVMALKSSEKPLSDETDKKLINTGALFLSKQLEV
ncbi:MAG: stage V sporulation protein T [Clostridiales bacterium GWF2_36_10]|nr:MAG: stage V sporulation protein T [Clostridiales bacterium GWF2_36_10]HAN20305.1 stage V sporulation protein T [Clostridiales bacterium]